MVLGVSKHAEPLTTGEEEMISNDIKERSFRQSQSAITALYAFFSDWLLLCPLLW